MRVWDVSPELLCRKHLLGQHREIHAIYSIIKNDKKGYRNHPEVKRWVGRLPQLRARHDETVHSMIAKGYEHRSPIEGGRDFSGRPEGWQTLKEQKTILKKKGCGCRV